MLFIRFIPAIAWFLVSLLLLTLPGSAVPKYPWLSLIYADKWVHITMFFILGYFFSQPFVKTQLSQTQRKKGFLLILFSGILYGISMEFVQKYWIPFRSFEIGDIIADSFGCYLAYQYAIRKFLIDRM